VAVASNASLDCLQSDERALRSRRTGLCKRSVTDEVALFHFAIAVKPGFPDIDGVADLMFVECHLRFETQRIPRSEAAGNNSEFLAGLDHCIPNALARRSIARNINLKSVFAGVACPRDQTIRQAANSSVREPVVLDWRQIDIHEFL